MDDVRTDVAKVTKKGSGGPQTAAELKASVLAELTYSVGKIPEVATPRDWYLAVAFATRDLIVERWMESTNAVYADGRKRVYYLSLEFLIGRLLFDAMTNLGIAEPMEDALNELGVSLTELRRIEPDAALGNGGLGRLAATGSSGRLFGAAGSRRRQRTGSSTVIRGSSSARNTLMRSASAALSKWCRATTSVRAISGTPPKRWKRSPMTRRSSAGAENT
jgi:hypothetical protein